jgi:stage V sporulation protein AB
MGDLLSAITGLSAGIVSGTALCAFYVALGVFSKSAESIGLKDADTLVSVSAASGGLLGILITLYGVSIPAGVVLSSLFGLFGGIYVGILIACLAEVTDAIPVVKNFGLARQTILLVLLAFVLGKTAGSLVYWLSGVF